MRPYGQVLASHGGPYSMATARDSAGKSVRLPTLDVRNGGSMSARLTEAEAVESMRAAGAEPLEPYPGSQSPWRCQCLRCGAEVSPRLAKIRYGRGPCAACGNRATGERRKAEHAETAKATMRALGLEPVEPYPGALTKWRCRCVTCGREVTPTYANAQQGETSCAYCAGNRVDRPQAIEAMRGAGVEPLEDFPGSDRPWRCLCSTCGRETAPTYGSIRNGQRACRYCSRRAVVPDEAVEVMRAADLEPVAEYPGANTPWTCECKRCGNTVAPTYGSVRQGSGGCRYCAGLGPISVEQAEADMRAAGFDPLDDYPGSGKQWRCQCRECGRESTPTLMTARRGARCGYCAGARVDPSEAADVMRAHELEPLEPYPGSHAPWLCRCLLCGREVRPRFHHVSLRGSSCRYCGKRGPDMTAPTFVYLLQHHDLWAMKVGVSRRDSARLRQHTERGWEVVRLWRLDTGEQAYRVEASVLAWLRGGLGLPPYLTAEQVPQGGWTETVGADSVDLLDLLGHIDAAVRAVD